MSRIGIRSLRACLLAALCCAAAAAAAAAIVAPGPAASGEVKQVQDMGCMRVVKFDCPGTEDPQPQLCGVPDAVPGTVKVAEPRPAEKLDKAAAASPAGAPINAGSKAVRLGGALLALATAVLLA